MSENRAKDAPDPKPALGRIGPPTNLRPAGPHEDAAAKKQERQIKERLKQQNFDEI